MKPGALGRRPEEPIRGYAAGQTADLLRRATFQAGRVCKLQHAASVHDLRVSIRRLSQCLRAFEQFLPPARTKKVRQKLKTFMDLASRVRNRDIALAQLRQAGLPPGSPLLSGLRQERARSVQELVSALQLWLNKGLYKKWRSRLGL